MIPAAGQAWRPVTALPLRGFVPAVRLASGLLAVLSALVWPPAALVPLGGLLAWCLLRAGWRPARLAVAVRPWLSVAVIVLMAHTVTATDVAPLGRPTLVGAGRGLLALARLALMLAAAAVTWRHLPLPDLTAAVSWWLRPLRPLGVDPRHLGLVLAVALGTAPRVVAEAERVRACLRLRRADGRRQRPDRRFREMLLVVPPLLAGLERRAETLPLALAGRVPDAPAPPVRLPWSQGLFLVAWTAVLVLLG